MRSSNKSRSRNKSGGRSRNIGNVVNRVFESAGPEGKVRGTPQQIIEKYQGLARDAQLSNDRVAAENFQQHAEHYTRLLDEAQREQAERQASEDRKRPPQQGGDGSDERGASSERGQDDRGGSNRDDRTDRDDHTDRDDRNERSERTDRDSDDHRVSSRPADVDVLGQDQPDDAGLVETPENAANGGGEPVRKPRSRSRRPAAKASGADQNGEGKQAAEPPVQ